jgi:hypothetical protein
MRNGDRAVTRSMATRFGNARFYWRSLSLSRAYSKKVTFPTIGLQAYPGTARENGTSIPSKQRTSSSS